MEAESRIRRLVAELTHRTDLGDYDGWVRLFTPDGRMILFGQEHVGHAALRAFIADDQPPHRRGMHYVTDLLITLGEGDQAGTAGVVSNFLFVAAGSDAPVVVTGGRYHDRVVEQGGEWLFQERRAELVLPPASRAWGADAAI